MSPSRWGRPGRSSAHDWSTRYPIVFAARQRGEAGDHPPQRRVVPGESPTGWTARTTARCSSSSRSTTWTRTPSSTVSARCVSRDQRIRGEFSCAAASPGAALNRNPGALRHQRPGPRRRRLLRPLRRRVAGRQRYVKALFPDNRDGDLFQVGPRMRSEQRPTRTGAAWSGAGRGQPERPGRNRRHSPVAEVLGSRGGKRRRRLLGRRARLPHLRPGHRRVRLPPLRPRRNPGVPAQVHRRPGLLVVEARVRRRGRHALPNRHQQQQLAHPVHRRRWRRRPRSSTSRPSRPGTTSGRPRSARP